MQYVVKSSENIYDVALKLYGKASYVVKLLTDNPSIDSLSANISNISVYYDETVKASIKTPLIVSNNILSDKKNYYTIKNGQSIYDLAIYYGYGISGVVEFLQDFPQLVNLDNNSIQDNQILVTKRNTNVNEVLFLQNKTLSTSLIVLTTPSTTGGGSFDDSFDDSFDNGN
jgi:hypothetical protein